MNWLHQDHEEFKAAIQYTTSKTQFSAELIEKDYYCSVVLSSLFHQHINPLCFKGGTALNKIHTGFYRLSEDLDFTLNTEKISSRPNRSRVIEPLKIIFSNITDKSLGLTVTKELQGHNESKQYTAEINYISILSRRPGTIKVDIALKENLVEPIIKGPVRTLLENPITGNTAIDVFTVPSLSLVETYAEKIRAALTRDPPAIRDIFDIWFAQRSNVIQTSESLLKITRLKFEKINAKWIPLKNDRELLFRKQLKSNLEPVLRPKDFSAFNIQEAFDFIKEIEEKLTALN
jgi:predicted nucleotidyltransferase component of viral defense system